MNSNNIKLILRNKIQDDFFKSNRGLNTRDIRFGFEAGFEAAWEYIINNKHVITEVSTPVSEAIERSKPKT